MSLFNRLVLVLGHLIRCTRRISLLRQQTSGHHPRTSEQRLSRLTHAFTDRTSIHDSLLISHTRKRETGHTHTHSVTICEDERRIRLPVYDFSTIQSFQRFTLTSDQKLLGFLLLN